MDCRVALAPRNDSAVRLDILDEETFRRTGFQSLSAAAIAVLSSLTPAEKIAKTSEAASAWRSGAIRELGSAMPPERPARSARPPLRPPKDMPRRRLSRGTAGRRALLHAIAHIELNAIDLAWDIIARFTHEDLPRAFYDDWVKVAAEEAEHHALVAERLADFDTAYGDLPAHDGLWEAAEATAGSLIARLAVVPLVLEARGLDVTPPMIARLEELGDQKSAAVLKVIYEEEIGHVAVGKRWFDYLCARDGLRPEAAWQDLVARHFKGQIKPPFNRPARERAHFPASFYEGLAGGG